MTIRAPALIGLLVIATACGDADPPAQPASAVDAPVPARFTVRGRWDDPRALTFRVEPEHGPVDAETFNTAIEDALAAWTRAGPVAFRPARPGEPASVTYSWRRGPHDDCPPFGKDMSAAHTGPMGPAMFVHFDGGLEWSLAGEPGTSLRRGALHETGHVLGLGHGNDPDALMNPDTRADAPMSSDLAGLHSLYGGGDDGPGDLRILRAAPGSGDRPAGAARAVAPALRGVAPRGCAGFRLFDTDGDGRDEVLVWRTDEGGSGELLAYHFAPGPVLAATVGPLVGVVPRDADTRVVRGPDGRRWLLSLDATGFTRLREFDASGRLRDLGPLERRQVDVDALFAEAEVLAPATAGPEASTGDLDGDGVTETVVRGGR